MLKLDEYLPSVNCVFCADMYILVRLSTVERLSALLFVRCGEEYIFRINIVFVFDLLLTCTDIMA
jgi:hypothetical protein